MEEMGNLRRLAFDVVEHSTDSCGLGGWSSSENVGTIMRYLLDELMSYEEGFTDIMMEDRPINRHETFMGALDSPIIPISAQDLQVFGTSLIQQVQLAVATTIQPFSPTPSQMLSNTLHPVPSLEFRQCMYYLVWYLVLWN